MSLIKKPSELDVQTTVKALIYGQPGVRKTTFALSAPSPLLLDFDGGVHRVDPIHQTETVQVKSWADVMAVITQEDLSPFKTLVIDTAGKMLDFMSAYLIANDPKLGKKDGSLTLPGYGARKAMFVNFLKQIAAMGKHLIFVAHEREEKEGEQKIIRPEIGGSSAGDLIKELDLVGYMFSIGNKKVIGFEPTEKYYGKNTCKLPAVLDVTETLSVADGHASSIRPNNQLSSIIEIYQKSLEERKQVALEYNALLDLIRNAVEEANDAEELNNAVEWAQGLQHIWDSKLQASLAIKEKATALGLILNKDKKYQEAKKEEVHA